MSFVARYRSTFHSLGIVLKSGSLSRSPVRENCPPEIHNLRQRLTLFPFTDTCQSRGLLYIRHRRDKDTIVPGRMYDKSLAIVAVLAVYTNSDTKTVVGGITTMVEEIKTKVGDILPLAKRQRQLSKMPHCWRRDKTNWRRHNLRLRRDKTNC